MDVNHNRYGAGGVYQIGEVHARSRTTGAVLGDAPYADVNARWVVQRQVGFCSTRA